MHIHRTSLDVPPGRLADRASVLAPDELARAERFAFERDRRRFIVARAALRSILGLYLGIAPRRIVFSYSPLGKPALAAEMPNDGIAFNLSHSAELSLVAVTRERAVGVDVEHLNRDVSHDGIADRFFSERERRDLAAVPPADRKRAFLDCWTRKEAFIKASGEGLFRGLNTFDVSLEPGEGARELTVRNDPENPLRWKLRAFEPAPDYAGAVVVDGRLEELQYIE